MGALIRTLGVGAGAFELPSHRSKSGCRTGLASEHGGYPRVPFGRGVDEPRAGARLGSRAATMRLIQMPCWARDDARQARLSRGRSAGIVAGAGLGLAAGTLLAEAWDPSTLEDVVLAGVVGAGRHRCGVDGVHARRKRRPHRLVPGCGSPHGRDWGLVASHVQPVTLQQSAMMGYGAIVGVLLGAGVTLLPPESVSAKTRAAVVLSSGIVAQVSGLGLTLGSSPLRATGPWSGSVRR